MTNASGREDSDFNFEFEPDTEVYFSCGLTYRGEHFVFGGRSKKTQIAKIDGCQLRSIGQLNFKHIKGACANVADEEIYLCFSWGDSNGDNTGDEKKCRKASSPLGAFEEVRQSNTQHLNIRIAASQSKLIINKFIVLKILDEILALGGVNPFNKIAEIFNTEQATWSTIQSYPFDQG